MITKLLLAAAAIAGPFGNKTKATITVQVAEDGEVQILSSDDLDGYTTDLSELPRVIIVGPDGERKELFSPEMFGINDPSILYFTEGDLSDAYAKKYLLGQSTWTATTELSRSDQERMAREAERMVAEQGRMMAEQERILAESYRMAEERARVAAERAAYAQQTLNSQFPSGLSGQQMQSLDASLSMLQEQLMAMSQEWAAADTTAQREQLRAAIEVKAGEMFDVRMTSHEVQLEQMRNRLLTLEAELEAQRDGRDEMIEQWMTERLGE